MNIEGIRMKLTLRSIHSQHCVYNIVALLPLFILLQARNHMWFGNVVCESLIMYQWGTYL